MYDFDEIRIAMEEMVSLKRWKHSCRTADYAVFLAERYGADTEKARLAGLTHDISRGQSPEVIREWAKKDRGILSDYEESHPVVLHGFASAWYLRFRLNVTDESVLEAVRWHTTGTGGMDTLAKVVFAADYMEPGRVHLGDGDRTRLLELPLDDLVRVILEATGDYLEKNGITMSPDSRELYLSLTKR